MVTVIIATYNRAGVLPRAIKSVLAQDYNDLEIIVVDDGSTDNTPEVIRSFTDDRIKTLRHEGNKGVCAAKNTGLANIHGEWFTFLDDDDEMLPNAIRTMLETVETVDPEITAITCNCLNAVTRKFSGTGLDRDQYVDLKTFLGDLKGEHWGIMKTSLLGEGRFNEHSPCIDSILWYKIQKRGKRYYMHRALRIYHTEGSDHVTRPPRPVDLQKRYSRYLNNLKEREYLSDMRKFNAPGYKKMMVRAAATFIEAGDRARARGVLSELSGTPGAVAQATALTVALLLGSRSIRLIRLLQRAFRR